MAQLFDTEYYLLAVAASVLALKLFVAPFLFPYNSAILSNVRI